MDGGTLVFSNGTSISIKSLYLNRFIDRNYFEWSYRKKKLHTENHSIEMNLYHEIICQNHLILDITHTLSILQIYCTAYKIFQAHCKCFSQM